MIRVPLCNCIITIHINRNRFRNSDSICDLNLSSFTESSGYKTFGNPSSSISSRSINFGWVFSWESTSTVTSPSSISINNYFSSGKTSISMRSSDNEFSRRIKEIYSFIINKFGRNNFFYNLFFQSFWDFFLRNSFSVLSGNKYGMNSNWS